MSNPKFKVLYEKLRGKTFEINRDAMSIGRRDTMDICIKDATLSGHHADIIRSQRDGKVVYILRDNDSTNGTKVNNVPITEQELKNSDIIQLGGVEILYDCSTGGESEFSTGGFGGRTHTISLDDMSGNLSTTSEVTNYSPFAGRDLQKQKRNHLIMTAVLIFLGVALVGALAFVVWSLRGGGH